MSEGGCDAGRQSMQAACAGVLRRFGVEADALVDFEGFLEFRFWHSVAAEAAQPGGEGGAGWTRAEQAAGLFFIFQSV